MCYAAIAAGTAMGGWRIVRTMGMRITRLRPFDGFCAETGGAMTILFASSLGVPVSTTHTITGAIVGVGASKRLGAVRWGVARRIVWAWVLTIPAAAVIAAAVFWCCRNEGDGGNAPASLISDPSRSDADLRRHAIVIAHPDVRSRRPPDLSRAQLLELYRWMRLTRTLEERLVALYRQTKVVGGLFRSLGQEACAVGSAYALERRDVLSPLIRNLGSMLVKGAEPVEILRQYMAKGDSPTRGRELNIHFGDVVDRNFVGQISHLGDMVPVMAGVTLTFRMRGEDRVGLVYVGDGATSTGAFHEGINFAAVQRCPLVVVVENNGYAYSTPTNRQTAAARLVDKAVGYGVPGVRADGNDVLEVYHVTRAAVDQRPRRRRRDAARADDLPAQGPRRARQPELRAARRDRNLGGDQRSDRSLHCATHRRVRIRCRRRSSPIDDEVRATVDAATDVAEAVAAVRRSRRAARRVRRSRRRCRCSGIAAMRRRRSTAHERPAGWGTHDG